MKHIVMIKDRVNHVGVYVDGTLHSDAYLVCPHELLSTILKDEEDLLISFQLHTTSAKVVYKWPRALDAAMQIVSEANAEV